MAPVLSLGSFATLSIAFDNLSRKEAQMGVRPLSYPFSVFFNAPLIVAVLTTGMRWALEYPSPAQIDVELGPLTAPTSCRSPNLSIGTD